MCTIRGMIKKILYHFTHSTIAKHRFWKQSKEYVRVLCFIKWWQVGLWYVVLRHILLCYILLRHVTPCYVTLWHVMLRPVLLSPRASCSRTQFRVMAFPKYRVTKELLYLRVRRLWLYSRARNKCESRPSLHASPPVITPALFIAP